MDNVHWTWGLGGQGARGGQGSRAEGAEEAEGAEVAEVAEEGKVAEGADGTDMAAIYILSYGKNAIGNRLYGFMGLRSKMSDWMEWIPLKLL